MHTCWYWLTHTTGNLSAHHNGNLLAHTRLQLLSICMHTCLRTPSKISLYVLLEIYLQTDIDSHIGHSGCKSMSGVNFQFCYHFAPSPGESRCWNQRLAYLIRSIRSLPSSSSENLTGTATYFTQKQTENKHSPSPVFSRRWRSWVWDWDWLLS